MTHELTKVISYCSRHPEADVYRKLWGSAATFEMLPIADRNNLFAVPLQRRRYRSAPAFVKLFSTAENQFLAEWAYDDIAREPYGYDSKRPMVYLSDPHENVAVSLWCYERGMVPLIGESHNSAVACAMAEKYRIDSLIADTNTVDKLRPFFGTTDARVDVVSVIGSNFAPDRLHWLARHARTIRLVLSLPETGVIAEAQLGRPFSAVTGCRIELSDTIIVSKDAMLITPIIRYDTGLPAACMQA